MKFVVYVKNLMLNEKWMEFLIHNICKNLIISILFKSFLYRALKNQMTLVQTLSENNQTKLDHNEQQVDQVNCLL